MNTIGQSGSRTLRVIWACRHGHRADQLDPNYRLSADRPFDPPLSPRGRQQAAEVAQRLACESIAAIFSSPFRRTVQTASIIAEHLQLTVGIEPGLAEWLRDEWFEGASEPLWLATHALANCHPQVDPTHEPVAIQPNFPETNAQMLQRVAATVDGLTQRHQGNLLLIGHGASVAGAARGLLGAAGPVGVTTPLCCLVKIDCRDGIWGIERNGSDVSHLSDTSDLHWC